MKLNYVIIPLIMIIVSSLGSIFMNQGMTWYQTLKMPGIAPPGFVIGTVWTIIFILTAISALIVYNSLPRDRIFKWIISFFIANAVLNALWSFLFFTQQLIFISIIEMVILNLTVIALIVLIWPRSKLAASLLIPYSVWVSFATFLAYGIYLLNT